MCTLGEVKLLCSRRELLDKMMWMHTSHIMALHANINKGKQGKTLSWEDFNPYEYQRIKNTKPAELDSVTRAKFDKMTKALNRNGKTIGSN